MNVSLRKQYFYQETDTFVLNGSLLAIPSGTKLKYTLLKILLRKKNLNLTNTFPSDQLSRYSNHLTYRIKMSSHCSTLAG